MESRPNRVLLFIGVVFTPIVSILFACVISGLVLNASEGIASKEMPRSVVLLMLIIVFGAILILFIRYMLRDANRYYVTIDDENIYFGRKKEIKLPYNEIAAIIAGLPEKMASGIDLNRYLNHRLWLWSIAERKRALLIINRDSSIIQFNIHSSKDGTRLMEAFANRNTNKMIADYAYDDEQIKILKHPKWNRICRSFQIEKAFGDVKAPV